MGSGYECRVHTFLFKIELDVLQLTHRTAMSSMGVEYDQKFQLAGLLSFDCMIMQAILLQLHFVWYPNGLYCGCIANHGWRGSVVVQCMTFRF